MTHRCSGRLSSMLLFGSGSPWRLVEETVTADGLGVAAADTAIVVIILFFNVNIKEATGSFGLPALSPFLLGRTF